MACLRAIEVSSEVSAEISGTPRRTCTGSTRPRAAAPSRRRRRPSASAATGGCGAPPRPRRARGARVARRRLRRCRPASWAWRPRRSNPINPCQRGVPGVAQGRYYTRASAYAACAAASSIFGRFLSAARGGIATFSHGLLPLTRRELETGPVIQCGSHPGRLSGPSHN